MHSYREQTQEKTYANIKREIKTKSKQSSLLQQNNINILRVDNFSHEKIGYLSIIEIYIIILYTRNIICCVY